MQDIESEEARWAIVISEPQRDFAVEQGLRREGYRAVFLYWRKLLTGHRGDWRKTHAFVSRPLFEGYGFVQLWPGQEWPDPARIAGLHGLLGGSAPVWIDDETIAAWRRRTETGEYDDKLPVIRKFAGAKFISANSEEERKSVFSELLAKMGAAQHAVAS